MNRIIYFFLFMPFFSFSQKIEFEKIELDITRDVKVQTKLVKISQKDNSFNSDIKVTIKNKNGIKIILNPQVIEYEFKQLGSKEYVFPIFFNDTDTTIKTKSIEYLELSYTVGTGTEAKIVQETFSVNILPFKEPKSELPDDFPNLIIFAGTNIDPVGEYKVTSGSFNIEKNFTFDDKFLGNKWGLQFGAFTHKNQTKDSTSLRSIQYAPDIASKDGLVKDKSYIYTQSFNPNISTSTRSSGGYLNLTRELLNGTSTKVFTLFGAELALRKFNSTANPITTRKDSTIYKGTLTPIGASPLTKDNFYIPSRVLTQFYLNLGFRIVNNSEKLYLVLQPMWSVDTFNDTSFRPTNAIIKKGRGNNFSFRSFIVYKPFNISAMIDVKLSAINYNFYNFSVGIPIDLKGVFNSGKK